MTGTVEMAGHNISGLLRFIRKVINLYGDRHSRHRKVEEGFDGETAWEMNALQAPASKTRGEGGHRAFLEDFDAEFLARLLYRRQNARL